MTNPATLFHGNKVLAILDTVEEKLLCLLLAAMIILACVQIFLRYFYSSGLLWIDPLLRYLVLWCGLIGAVSATSQGKHIALDLTGGRLPPAIDPWLALLTHFFCILASAGLTWAGWLFLRGEIEAGGVEVVRSVRTGECIERRRQPVAGGIVDIAVFIGVHDRACDL